MLGPKFTAEWLQESVIAHILPRNRHKALTAAKSAGLRENSKEWAEFQMPPQALRNLQLLRSQWSLSKTKDLTVQELKNYMKKSQIAQLRIPSSFKGKVVKLETARQMDNRLEREQKAAAKGREIKRRKQKDIVDNERSFDFTMYVTIFCAGPAFDLYQTLAPSIVYEVHQPEILRKMGLLGDASSSSSSVRLCSCEDRFLRSPSGRSLLPLVTGWPIGTGSLRLPNCAKPSTT